MTGLGDLQHTQKLWNSVPLSHPSRIPLTDPLLVPVATLSPPSHSLFLSFNTLLSHPVLFPFTWYSNQLLFSSHLFRTGSIKSSRRSSYLLAITTERSKSCDEGLHTLRDDSRVFPWVFRAGLLRVFWVNDKVWAVTVKNWFLYVSEQKNKTRT